MESSGTLQEAMAMIMRSAAMAGVRRVQQPVMRQMSTSMPAAEELSLQKLYPGFRSSWFGEPGQTVRTGWDSTKKIWFIVEAYPLFVAIGGGCGICFLHCMRHFMFSPDVMVNKTNRANPMIENTREGANWKGNPLRIMGNMKKNKTDPFR